MEIRHRKQSTSCSFAKRSVNVVNFANHSNRQQYNKGAQKVEIFFSNHEFAILLCSNQDFQRLQVFRIGEQFTIHLPTDHLWKVPPFSSYQVRWAKPPRSPNIKKPGFPENQEVCAENSWDRNMCGGGWLGQSRRHKKLHGINIVEMRITYDNELD